MEDKGETCDTAQSRKSLWYIYSCISLWIGLSTCMVLTNKHILAYTTFRYPIALAFWHMVVATVLSWCCVHIGGVSVPAPQQLPPLFRFHMLAIGGLFALTLCLGNAAYMLLHVPTIQMLKASTPVAILCIGLALKTESYSHTYLINILVITTGVGIASYGDYNFNMLGCLLQLGAIAVDALRCVLLQKMLQDHNVGLNALSTLYHVAPGATLALLVPMLLLEGQHLHLNADTLLNPLPLVIMSAFLAFALNLIIFCVIGATSALTTSVFGILKEWVCILLAMRMHHVAVGWVQWSGYVIALGGLMCYQHFKLNGAPSTTKHEAADAAGDAKQQVEDKV